MSRFHIGYFKLTQKFLSEKKLGQHIIFPFFDYTVAEQLPFDGFKFPKLKLRIVRKINQRKQ